MSESVELSTILGGPDSSDFRICRTVEKVVRMVMSLIIKYFQENRELTMMMMMMMMSMMMTMMMMISMH